MRNTEDKNVASTDPDDGGASQATSLHQSGLRNTTVQHQYSIQHYDGWQTFELMPPTYRVNRDARATFYRWSTAVVILLAITIGSSFALWLKGQRSIRRNHELAAAAQPLRDIRTQAERLEAENRLSEKWILWVQSARPDDSLLQVMASVAHATHTDARAVAEDHLDVQSIDVKLPIEYGKEAPKIPTWAEPRFAISVLAKNRAVVMAWEERLENVDRITQVKANTPGGAWREAQVQVTGVPISTRMVP